MPMFLDEVLDSASNEIRDLCGNDNECIFDVTETGNMEIGLETLQTSQDNNNDQMIACKFWSITINDVSLIIIILFCAVMGIQ